MSKELENKILKELVSFLGDCITVESFVNTTDEARYVVLPFGYPVNELVYDKIEKRFSKVKYSVCKGETISLEGSSEGYSNEIELRTIEL